MAKKKTKPLSDLRDLKLDLWQRRVLAAKGNIALRCGRQTGKSTIVAIKARELAYQYEGTTTLVIAASQRQSSLLFEKIRVMLEKDDAEKIRKAKIGKNFTTKVEEKNFEKTNSIFLEDPTLTRVRLKNGSTIYCLPTGKTGAYIRGFTVDFMIADEAPLIPDSVWIAVVPMMATSRKERKTGWMILLGTPMGKSGFFYEAFQSRDFKHFHIKATTCKRIGKVFLRKQRQKMSKISYQQEFLAEFVEEYEQFFPTELIESCATAKGFNFSEEYGKAGKKYFLGVDVARFGGDENAFFITEMANSGSIRGVFWNTTKRVSLTETIGRIKALDKKWKFKKIFIDGAGVGGGVVDVLVEQYGRRIVELNNANRTIDADDRRKKLLKEDLYSNLLVLMEQGLFKFERSAKVISSLRGMTFEYTLEGALRIKGKGSHLAEAIVRAAWCNKHKGLNLFLA